jgi:myosin heavy subunit
METNNQKTTTYVLTGIIAVLVIGLFLAIGSNVKNKKNLRAEKLTSSANLFEKQKVDGNLEKLKTDLSELQKQYDANNNLLSESTLKIAENEKRINSLSGQNRSLIVSKKELEELKKTKEELEKEYSKLKSDNDRLLSQGRDLQNSLKTLETEKNDLSAQLDKAKMYNTDNFLVTASKGKKKEKIVVVASRAKKLNMTFEVPQNLTETISFKIVTPAGTTINPDDKSVSWYFPLSSRDFTASLSAVSGEFEQSRQVVLNYTSKVKLIKGEYKIQILSNGNNIGNCRFMLR